MQPNICRPRSKCYPPWYLNDRDRSGSIHSFFAWMNDTFKQCSAEINYFHTLDWAGGDCTPNGMWLVTHKVTMKSRRCIVVCYEKQNLNVKYSLWTLGNDSIMSEMHLVTSKRSDWIENIQAKWGDWLFTKESEHFMICLMQYHFLCLWWNLSLKYQAHTCFHKNITFKYCDKVMDIHKGWR